MFSMSNYFHLPSFVVVNDDDDVAIVWWFHVSHVQ